MSTSGITMHLIADLDYCIVFPFACKNKETPNDDK